MNKTKRAAWHKHLKKAHKAKEKARAAREPQVRQPAAARPGMARQTTPRRPPVASASRPASS